MNKPQNTDAVLGGNSGSNSPPPEAGAAVLGGLKGAIAHFENLGYLNELHIAVAAATIAEYGDDGMAYLLSKAVFYSRFYKCRAARDYLKKTSLDELLGLINRINDHRKLDLLELLPFIRQHYFLPTELAFKPKDIETVAAVYNRPHSRHKGRSARIHSFAWGGNLQDTSHCNGQWINEVDGKIQVERNPVRLLTRYLVFYVDKRLVFHAARYQY